MKTLVILFASSKSLHMFDKVFAGKSSFERSLDWAQKVKEIVDSEIILFGDYSIKKECLLSLDQMNLQCSCRFEEEWTVHKLFQEFSNVTKEKNAENILFAWADSPFINSEITKKILDDHLEYSAEFTFADGYPEGLCPEALNSGTSSILSELSMTLQKEVGEKEVCRTSIFDLIKTDINSFEIETVISDEDYRLFRLHFNCGTKANLLACTNLFALGIENLSLEEISQKAVKCEKILKTLPSYYAIQITDKVNLSSIYKPDILEKQDGRTFMPLSDFKALIEKISLFSENAVVSLSAWGEALCHPDLPEMIATVLEKPALSVLLETDGLLMTETLADKIKSIVDSAADRISGGEIQEKIYWIVTLDSFSPLKYKEVNGNFDSYEKAFSSVGLLQKYFPSQVYPQFTRMNENENELEAFFRFWSDKQSPSAGKLIVQKYDSFCQLLPDRKPADLSPLERNPCWHIRRDMTILVDGSVSFCRSCLKNGIIGNAFKEKLEDIWARLDSEVKCQMDSKYSKFCEKCDEYYTFNF